MLGKPRLSRKISDVTERDNQVVVLELELPRPYTRGNGNPGSGKVDLFDGPRVEVRPRAEPPDRRDGVDDPDAPGDDLGQHRLEDQVVVATHEPDLHLAALDLAGELLLQRHSRVDPPEPAAEDQDSRGRDRVACHHGPHGTLDTPCPPEGSSW